MKLTNKQLKVLRYSAKLELSRRNLLDFVKMTHKNYEAGFFHEELCKVLEEFSEAVERKESPRLIIAVPPRHGKTVIVSQRYPVWSMGKYNHSFVCASYGADLAHDNSRAARDIARSDIIKDCFNSLDPHDNKSELDKVSKWTCKNGSIYTATSVTGPLTGKGCHILVIDDPIKDRRDSKSPAIKKALQEWYTSTAYTRLEAGGGIIVMSTRWAVDDLSGFLIDNQEHGDKWEVLSFPAIAEKDEKFRKIGEALHAERFSVDRLLKIKNAIGATDWASLYQQRPSPLVGGIIKREWLKRYSFNAEKAFMDSWLIVVDATFKGKDTSDYVVFQTWGKKDSGMYILDQLRARMGFTQTRAALRDFCNKWSNARTILIEDKANGSALIDELGKEIQGIVPYNPLVSKEERLHVSSVYCEAGNVYIPENSSWTGDLIEELISFPNGKHDDQVDAFSMAIIRMTETPKYDASAGINAYGFLGDY